MNFSINTRTLCCWHSGFERNQELDVALYFWSGSSVCWGFAFSPVLVMEKEARFWVNVCAHCWYSLSLTRTKDIKMWLSFLLLLMCNFLWYFFCPRNGLNQSSSLGFHEMLRMSKLVFAFYFRFSFMTGMFALVNTRPRNISLIPWTYESRESKPGEWFGSGMEFVYGVGLRDLGLLLF